MKLDYKAFLADGIRYLEVARGGFNRPAVFNTEILYNILGMAIEKDLMALLMANGDMADNHTFTDLINSVNRVCPMDFGLAQDLIDLEQAQNLCPVGEDYHQACPERDDIAHMIIVAERIEAFVQSQLCEVTAA